jgi:hypothetical protein
VSGASQYRKSIEPNSTLFFLDTGVVGPDVYRKNKELRIVNNSLYTNVATSITMASAEYLWCLAGKAGVELVPTQWKTFLDRVALPRSGTLLLPFDGYKGTCMYIES